MLHLPVLLLLIGVFAMSTFVSSKFISRITSESPFSNGSVLSSGSDGDEDDGGDDNDDSGDDNDDSDNDNDSDDDKDSNNDDDEHDSDSYNSSSDTSFEKHESDDANETKSEVRVQNADGTFSIIKTEEEDGELKREIKTYDASGNKIRVEKYESEDGEEKSRVSVYDGLGNKLSDIRFETEDGKELELRVKEGETELSRIKFDSEKQELIVKTNTSVFESANSGDESGENELRIKLDGDNFLLTRNGVNASSRFPLVVDDATGTVSVQTPNGEIRLGVMPDTIIEKAQALDNVDSVSSVALEAGDVSSNTSDRTALEFKMTGAKSEKLLGVFALQIPSVVTFDAQTGNFLRNEQTFVTKLLDLFSF